MSDVQARAAEVIREVLAGHVGDDGERCELCGSCGHPEVVTGHAAHVAAALAEADLLAARDPRCKSCAENGHACYPDDGFAACPGEECARCDYAVPVRLADVQNELAFTAKERDAARAELAVARKQEASQTRAAVTAWAAADRARAELAEVKAKGLPQDEVSAAYHELGTHGVKQLIATAERRGAVAALREAADETAIAISRWKNGGIHPADWLRARADRIEGEDRE